MDQEREKLLTRIQICDFILVETNLFLDTHPDFTPAVEYFNKYNEMRKALTQEYSEKYGPLTPGDNKDTEKWTWVDMPWPWHNMEV